MTLDEIQAAIVAEVRKGHTLKAAAGAYGFTLAAIREWVSQGRQGSVLHRWFAENVEGAEWDGRRKLEAVVLKAALGDGDEKPPNIKAAQYALEKFHWEHYDPAAIVAREANLALLSTPELQDKFIEILKASPELQGRAKEALSGLQRREGQEVGAAGHAERGAARDGGVQRDEADSD